MSKKLKACPFCGSMTTIHLFRVSEIEMESEYGNNDYAVCCAYDEGGCGATGGYRSDPEEAVKAWNSRRGE